MLLRSGADCRQLDQHGNTTLHLAARIGNEYCLERLLVQWYCGEGVDIHTKPTVDTLNYDGIYLYHLNNGLFIYN